MSAQPCPSTSWSQLADDLGFEPATRGRSRSGIAVSEEQRWIVLTRRARFTGDPLRDLMGAPGLWRAVPAPPSRGTARRRRRAWSCVFEIPPGVANFEGEGEPDEEHPMAELLGWARATSDGTPPPTAGGVERDEVETWVEPTRRHIRAGGQVVPIELTAGASRLGLAAPALVRIPETLSATRRAWIQELCLEAQSRWRLVRLGIDDDGVRAEVDLSGAPLRCAQQLFEIGLAALTTASAWALPALAAVVDERVESRLFNQPPARDALPAGTKGGPE